MLEQARDPRREILVAGRPGGRHAHGSYIIGAHDSRTLRDRVARTVAFPWHHARIALWDRIQNRRYTRGERRFLVVRDPRSPFVYDLLLHWLAAYFPDVRAAFELHPLPCRIRDWSRYALHVPWLQDPVQATSPALYRAANRLAAQCDRHDVPVINRVDRLANAGKSAAASVIAATGLRTPKMARIESVAEFRRSRLGVPLPLFVREDWGHGGALLRADTDAEARALPIESLRRPVAVELVDVRDPRDGLYRKYRYVVAGDVGIPQTLHVSPDWVTRGDAILSTPALRTDALRDEELAYTRRQEPDHERFVAAARALGLDFVAFDYGVDRAGATVVWEANPYPFLHFIAGRGHYRAASTTRVLAAMTKLYLDRAGMAVPEGLAHAVGG